MGACYSMVLSDKRTIIGSWHDCINPLSLPVHAHYFEVGTIYYPQKICPMCWKKLLVIQNYQKPGIAIVSRFGYSPRHANKQKCGSDTL